jgi:hypothetical protein
MGRSRPACALWPRQIFAKSARGADSLSAGAPIVARLQPATAVRVGTGLRNSGDCCSRCCFIAARQHGATRTRRGADAHTRVANNRDRVTTNLNSLASGPARAPVGRAGPSVRGGHVGHSKPIPLPNMDATLIWCRLPLARHWIRIVPRSKRRQIWLPLTTRTDLRTVGSLSGGRSPFACRREERDRIVGIGGAVYWPCNRRPNPPITRRLATRVMVASTWEPSATGNEAG